MSMIPVGMGMFLCTHGVTPQPALSCDVHDLVRSRVKSYQDFSIVMNKIVGAKLYQI